MITFTRTDGHPSAHVSYGRSLRMLGLAALFICLVPITAIANTQTVQLSKQTLNQPKRFRGYIRGTVGLHNIVGERDQLRRRCMGYGSASPDYQLEVTEGMPSLALQVRSRAKDTTLVIKGPNNRILCADDSALGKDAGMTLQNLEPGLYQVWVGAFEIGDRFSYTLSLQ